MGEQPKQNACPNCERLAAGIRAVQGLINESHGVYGLHLNGDPAPWESLQAGGRFEEWLAPFDDACDVASLDADPATMDAAEALEENMSGATCITWARDCGMAFSVTAGVITVDRACLTRLVQQRDRLFADGMAHAASRQSASRALLDEIGNAAAVQQQIGQGEYEVGNVAKSEWHKGKAAGMLEVLAMIAHSHNKDVCGERSESVERSG